MTHEEKDLLLKDLCARLPYGVRGKVKADTVVPHKYDIDGFPLETTFDVDVELQRIDASNDEIFVSTFDNNEDLGNYIEECQADIPYTIEEFTPYLRSMSSMTEEEAKEIAILHDIKDILSVKVTSDYIDVIVDDGVCSTETRTIWYDEIVSSVKCFDLLTAYHFDYRGLIEKGLSIKVTEENNPYK